MSLWIKKTSMMTGLALAMVFNLAFVEKGQLLELDANLNARSSRNFTSQADNIEFVMPKGTQVRVDEVRRLNSGHYGLQVEVLSGSHQSKKVWVYYNTDNPRIRLASQSPIPARNDEGTTTRSVASFNRPIAQSADDLDLWFDRHQAIQVFSQSETAASGSQVCTDCSTPATSSQINTAARAVTQMAQNNVAVGARQTMAVLYQSCSVLTKPPYNPIVHGTPSRRGDVSIYKNQGGNRVRTISQRQLPAFLRNHYYLKDLGAPQAPQCRDMRKTPPVFIYGGRPTFPNRGREIEILGTRRQGQVNVTGLDCSAFASVALSAAGLKLRPGTKSAEGNLFTSNSLLELNGKNSCLDRPTFTPGKTIQTGDIYSVPGHVLIIDQVGPDPLGIEAMKRAGKFPTSYQQCYNMAPDTSKFNFKVIQSTGYGDKSALIGEASVFMRPHSSKRLGGTVFHGFRDIFEAACIAEFGYQMPADSSRRNRSALLRHRGAQDPNCVFSEDQKPKLRGQECTGDCLKEALQ